MKLVLSGREYSINEALQKATLADLYRLKVDTGIGMKTLKTSLDAMSELADPEDFLDDERILRALNALVWLCRRRAGETLTVEQATDVPLSEVAFATDDEDEAESGEGEPDPT